MFFRNILQVSYDFIRTFPIKVHKGQREGEFEYGEYVLTLKLALTLPPMSPFFQLYPAIFLSRIGLNV
jgi:hypothetical protein